MHAGLAIIGAIASLAGAHHHQQYWWPAMDRCTIGAKAEGNTIYVGIKPNVYCTVQPAHWDSKPPPVEQPAG